jgi:hypothetical protein
MAREYGFLEGFATKLGNYKICTSCDTELTRKGLLHISDTQYLLPSGRIKTRNAVKKDQV